MSCTRYSAAAGVPSFFAIDINIYITSLWCVSLMSRVDFFQLDHEPSRRTPHLCIMHITRNDIRVSGYWFTDVRLDIWNKFLPHIESILPKGSYWQDTIDIGLQYMTGHPQRITSTWLVLYRKQPKVTRIHNPTTQLLCFTHMSRHWLEDLYTGYSLKQRKNIICNFPFKQFIVALFVSVLIVIQIQSILISYGSVL